MLYALDFHCICTFNQLELACIFDKIELQKYVVWSAQFGSETHHKELARSV
jgi:hypothetical protein